jgi:NMD protein affecting ribosome stability and mRNA decay
MSNCPFCGKEINNLTEFRDDISVKDWKITGLCQACQDKTYETEVTPEEQDKRINSKCANCGSYFASDSGNREDICSNKCAEDYRRYLNSI